MPVWHTNTGRWGSISVIPEDRIVDKQGNSRVIPGFRLPLQLAWITTEYEPTDAFDIPASKAGFSRVAPEFVDTANLPPGVLMELKKAALHRDDWKDNPVKRLEEWLDSDFAKQQFSFVRGDPRKERPVRITMTAEDYAKFQKAKDSGKLKIDEVVVAPRPEQPVGVQKVRQGMVTTK